MKFFREENHKVIVDTEIKVVKQFRDLIAKDKDRHKREALKWFAYIYYMNDYRSPYMKETEDDRRRTIIRDLSLEENFKEFKELKEARDKYLELQETATVKSLKEIREGLVTSSRVIKMLKNRIETTLLDEENLEPEEEDAMIRNVTRMLELADKLPKAINTVKVLEEEVKKEQSSEAKIRGGGEKGDFED